MQRDTFDLCEAALRSQFSLADVLVKLISHVFFN